MPDTSLPADVTQGLANFVAAAERALGPDLVSIVLFGSAAEGRMRATSDVNVIVVCTRFEPQRLNALREPLQTAHALIQLSAMLLLDTEVPSAADAFAVKFADIHARHRVLVGSDPFAALVPDRTAMRARLKQVLLNFILRTRERYVLVSLREEQLAHVVADAAGPLRSVAEVILMLEGRPAGSPKAALEILAQELDGAGAAELLAHMSQAREQAFLPAGTGAPATLALIELAQALRARVDRIS
jgi:predicted nucleotidyltransferase